MAPLRALTGVVILGILSASRGARADAQQCVAQNNAAADHRANHQLLAAREAYRACVAEPGCPDLVRSECESALLDLKTAIPTLLVSVLNQQKHDAVGATLKVDGIAVAVDGTPIEVDPGPHQLLAAGSGGVAGIEVIGVENETNRQIELVLKAIAASPNESTDSNGGAAGVARSAPRRSHVPSYLLAGVGAAALGSFGYFAISGHTAYNQLEQCKPDCARSAVHDVRTKYLFADLSLGVSVLAFGAAGYLLLNAPPERPAKASSLSLSIIAAPQTAGLSLSWVK